MPTFIKEIGLTFYLTDENIVILPADKGRVTVVMDKTDYNDKMDSLVNDKHTYEPT